MLKIPLFHNMEISTRWLCTSFNPLPPPKKRDMITFTLSPSCSPMRCNRCSYFQTISRYNETSLPHLFVVIESRGREREYSHPRDASRRRTKGMAMHLPPSYTTTDILLRLLRVPFPTLVVLSYLPLLSAYQSQQRKDFILSPSCSRSRLWLPGSSLLFYFFYMPHSFPP